MKVWAGALQLARPVLESDPCQLASQILGRLGQMVIEDRPVAPGTSTKQHTATAVKVDTIENKGNKVKRYFGLLRVWVRE